MTLAVREVEIRGATGQPSLRTLVRRRVTAALAPITARPRTAQVTFFDDNGPKGGVAWRCAITLGLPHRPGIRVERTATTPRLAFDAAMLRLERQIERDRERDRESRRHPKKYFVARRLLTAAGPRPPRARRDASG